MSGREAPRAHEIDGIRGWAAFSVLLYHLFHETFGNVLPGTHNPFVLAWMNGSLAVFVFFVLSGDALSIGFLRREDKAVIDSLVLRRYTRLMIPVALSTFVVYLLMASGLVFNKAAAEIVGSRGWLGAFLDFEPGVIGFLRYVLIDVYSPGKVYSAPATQYNPMLWTMSIELAGSALVFLFWYLSTALRNRRRVLAVSALVLGAFGSYYSLFFAGMLMSQWRVDGVLDGFRAARWWQVVAPILIAATGFANAVAYANDGHRHFNLVCAVVIVFACYTSRPGLLFFRSRVSRFLGEISFPLYLVHFAVIVSFTSWLIVRVGPMDWNVALQVGSVSALVAMVAAFLFRYVEKAALVVVDEHLAQLLAPRELT